jgi:glycosyltransferase involved in cell wall biosynthesis
MLKRRIAKQKTKRLTYAHLYTQNPSVSFMVQSFNHKQNIPMILERLRQVSYQEIIVCEDGSTDGSLQTWSRLLDMPNDFLIKSNDLHEIRAYDRAIHLARGGIVCLLQDDEIAPPTDEWFHHAMALFDTYPDLVLLGGYLAFRTLESTHHTPHGPFPGDLTNLYSAPPSFIACDRIPFMFVEAINIGPVFIRRDRFLTEVGGFDLRYAPVGWPGIHFDVEMSLRTWLKGGQVGWYQPGFKQVGARATEAFGHLEKRLSQLKTNHDRLVTEYAEKMVEINRMVDSANLRLGYATKKVR